MATTTGSFNFYNTFREYMADGTMDLDTDVFTILLTTSTYTPNAETHTVLADITNEVTGNGYARINLANVAWTRSTVTVTFDSDDPVWTAAGGSIVAHYWVIFDNTPSSPLDPLVAYGYLDNSPADVTTTDTNTLTIQLTASGWFQQT